MDKYKIDSHKLIYHVDRVNDWLANKIVYPVYMEVSPAGACNHRCTYCGLDFMEYKPVFLDTGLFKERLSEMGKLGLKSIMYAGEGEPFLHKKMPDIALHTKKSGIDIAFTTNGVLLKKDITEHILGFTEWIKVSINGATEDTYSKIHRCQSGDFNKVIDNMKYAASFKRRNNLKCTLGMQLLLLPDNEAEAVKLARLARDIGMDYLVIKPYSQHPQSKTKKYKSIKYDNCMHLKDELERLNSKDFSAIFRIRTMEKWNGKERNYKHCLALPFWSYIDSRGNVWGCSVYLNDERFLYGNIYESSFRDIWESEKRLKSLKLVEEELDASECRINCRMDEINRYLWDLKNKPEHINFI